MNARYISTQDIVRGADQEGPNDYVGALRWAFRRSAARQVRAHRLRLVLIAIGTILAVAVLLRLFA